MKVTEFIKKCHWGKYRSEILQLCIDYEYVKDYAKLEKAKALCLKGATEDEKRWYYRQYKKLRHDFCVGNKLSFFLMGVVARLSKKDYLGAEEWIFTQEMQVLTQKWYHKNITDSEYNALSILRIGFDTRFNEKRKEINND